MPDDFERSHDRFGPLVCPWCPPTAKRVYIENYPHNPFKLQKRVRELEIQLQAKQHEVWDVEQRSEKVRDFVRALTTLIIEMKEDS